MLILWGDFIRQNNLIFHFISEVNKSVANLSSATKLPPSSIPSFFRFPNYLKGADSQLTKNKNMLKIRLSRGGRKKLPFYRILVTNHTSPRDSKFLEKVGTYNPLLADDKEGRVTIDKERIEHWLSVGAQPTERVAGFLVALGVKGAEKYKPDFKPKDKGSNMKKKALEAAKKEAEAKAAAIAEVEAAKAAAAAEAEAAKAEANKPAEVTVEAAAEESVA